MKPTKFQVGEKVGWVKFGDPRRQWRFVVIEYLGANLRVRTLRLPLNYRGRVGRGDIIVRGIENFRRIDEKKDRDRDR